MKNIHSVDVKYIKAYCECGHSVEFLKNHSAICNHCGRKVYPSKKCEFREKAIIELRKMKVNNNELCNFKRSFN